MTRICFNDIKFREDADNAECIVMVFLKLFEADISRESLKRLGDFTVSDGCLEISDLPEDDARKKLIPIIDRAFGNLKNKLTGCKTVYIHQNSGIPLIGSINFGIVDRGTNIIEVKPITGCNIDCVFCSVDEGKSTRKLVDFVVEDEYLADEVRKLVEYKQMNHEQTDHDQIARDDGSEGSDGQDIPDGPEFKIDVFINTHGEPLLYSNIVSLVNALRHIEQVGVISIITNGTMLSKNLADELIDAGLTQLNLSVNAIDPDKARELAGTAAYDVKHVLEIARYVSKKIKLFISPVWVNGLNDAEIPKLVNFARDIGAEIGIQNFLAHKSGRKPKKQVIWDDFYKKLDEWEKETGVPLRTKEHSLFETKTLEKPFRKGDAVHGIIVAPGRMKDEMLAEAKGRVISVVACHKKKGQIKMRMIRDKDNIFVAEVAK
ncbi:MAG: radical SAM protein [Candidatus Woesearchaeota archaeon]